MEKSIEENEKYIFLDETDSNSKNQYIQNLNKKIENISLSESQYDTIDNLNISIEKQKIDNEAQIEEILIKNNNVLDYNEKDTKIINNNKTEDKDKVEVEDKVKESQLYITKYNNTSFLDFYDLIIDFESLLKLEKGIKIYKKPNIDISTELKNIIVIGITGESKTGKSYVLSRISKIELPCGNTIITKGLSLKFPTDKNKNFLLIDTVGNESPLLESEIDIHVSTIIDFDERNHEFEKYFIDKQSTEIFIQKYILDISNVIIAVVGLLTNNDEKFINKITNLCENKTIYIIHNLKYFNTIEMCENHIKNVIKKSIFFNLTDSYYMFNVDKKYNTLFFVEKKSKKNNIVHLILAEENTEAGDYYNNTTFEYLQKTIISQTRKKKHFNLLKNFQESISLFSLQFFKYKIKENELEIINDQLKYYNNKNNILNRWYENEMGISDFYSELYKPDFSYEIIKINDDNIKLKIKIIIEIPGKIKVNGIESNEIIQKIIQREFHYYFEFKGSFTIKSDCIVDENSEYDTINYNKTEENETLFILPIHFELNGYNIIRNKKYSDYNKRNGIYTYICYFEENLEEEEIIYL
jgi:hypothetical protein